MLAWYTYSIISSFLGSPPSIQLVVFLQLLVHIVIVSKVFRPPRQNVRKDMGQKVTVALSSTIVNLTYLSNSLM